MGGRGASSGMSKGTKNSPDGNPYGSQYHTVYEYGDIKFVAKNDRQSEPLMETMTPGRIYVTIAAGEPDTITLFDEKNRRKRVIHLQDPHADPHSHKGYFHDEYDPDTTLSDSDRELIAKVREIWHNRT